MKYLIILIIFLWSSAILAQEVIVESKLTDYQLITIQAASGDLGTMQESYKNTKGIELTRKIAWTYYETGEVDEITIRRYVAGKFIPGKIVNSRVRGSKLIKHFRTGEQPKECPLLKD